MASLKAMPSIFLAKMKRSVTLILFSISVGAYLLYHWISSLPVSNFSDSNVEVNITAGEEIFWGKGRCHVCHRIGERGYALRGPNLGESKDGAVLPIRAHSRATELQLKTAVEYLVQSIAEPSAFVVPAYNNEMPEVFKAPIGLSPPEIKSVILYLSSLDGDTTFKEISLPLELYAAYSKPGESFVRHLKGNPASGEKLFFDATGPAACATCHIGIDGEGRTRGDSIGPDLRAIATFRTPPHIYQKIIKPDSNIVSGYEEALVKTFDGRLFIGRIMEVTQKRLVLLDRNKIQSVIRSGEVKMVLPQKTSNMPSNYEELLTGDQMNDLLAYLVTLTGN